MSEQVTTARHQQFQAMVRHLLQQQGSRLRGTVEVMTHSGKQAVAVDQVGTVTAVEKPGRHADLPVVSVPHARRWVFPTPFAFRDFVDRTDTLRMLWEPGNRYARAFAYSLGRAMDQKIIAAATGTSTIGETGDGTSTEAFDTTNFQVDNSGSTGMTMDKVKSALEKLMGANVDVMNEDKYLLVASQQYQNLLSETQVISADYMRDYTMESGRLVNVLGFKVIHTEELTLSSTTRTCLAYVRTGLHLGIWEDIRTPIDWIPEKQAWQVAGVGDFGATRLEQGRVVSIPCTEV